jgi:hypothetical protein
MQLPVKILKNIFLNHKLLFLLCLGWLGLGAGLAVMD